MSVLFAFALAVAGFDETSFSIHVHNLNAVEQINNRTADTLGVETITLLFDTLELDLKVEQFPSARSELMMQRGGNICLPNRVKNAEREQAFLFSLPINFYLENRFYSLADVNLIPAIHLDEQGKVVNIAMLMDTLPDQRILVPLNISFGEFIDNELSKVKPQQIISTHQTNYFEHYFGMLRARRADFAIFNSSALAAYAKTADIDLSFLRSYAIAGNQEIIAGHFMCANTPAGQAFIDKINPVIASLYTNPEYHKLYFKYLTQDEATEMVRYIQSKAAQ